MFFHIVPNKLFLKYYLIILKEKFRIYFKFENKKNQIKVIAFKLNIIPKNI